MFRQAKEVCVQRLPGWVQHINQTTILQQYYVKLYTFNFHNDAMMLRSLITAHFTKQGRSSSIGAKM